MYLNKGGIFAALSFKEEVQDMPELLVEMKDITKTFPGVKALNKARLELYKGEVLGLLGENGAGNPP